MAKYMVLARPPKKFNIMWNYAAGYFPRKVHYKSDANSIAESAKRKGGWAVAILPYSDSGYRLAVRQLQEKELQPA